MRIMADFHTHVVDHYDILINRKIPLIGARRHTGFFQPKNRIEEKLLKHSFLHDENTLVGIINFDDERAEKMLDVLKKIAETEGFEVIDRNYYASFKKDNSNVTFVSGQEVPTERGHVLLVGAGSNTESRDFDYVLKEAKNEKDSLILGDHVLGPGGMSLQERDIEKYAKYFDAINIWDGNFGEKYHSMQKELARGFGIPIYAASDSHTIKGILSCATILKNVDFSAENFKGSLRTSLIEVAEEDLIYGSNGFMEKYRHLSSVVYTIAGLKNGFLVRDS
ncbi:hypothetical protein HY450_00585 [Candidatus Pacearchaeota archaeon]|nr:hypothetical protein [Candidatus Pacearchaeota archaeon]